MASRTTAGSGAPSPATGSSAGPSRRTGRRAASAGSERPRGSAPSRGRRLVEHDRALGHRLVAGADEAGRGALAGPLVAAAVLLDLGRLGPGEVRALGRLDDSKRHDAASREALLEVVHAHAARVAVAVRGAAGIDARGLHRTNLDALADVLADVAPPEALCLVDGFALPALRRPHRPIVGGDGRSAAIAAASIVAKVTRDRIMVDAARAHPHWGLELHKGYASPAHRAAVRRHGPSPLHRLSFRSTAYEPG